MDFVSAALGAGRCEQVKDPQESFFAGLSYWLSDRADAERLSRKSPSNEEIALGTLIALIICTVLCLAFKESRALGIVGVLILILVAPLTFGALLVVVGLAYYFLFLRRRHEYIPGGNVLPPDEASRRRRGIGLLLLASGVVGALAVGDAPAEEDESINLVVQDETRSVPAHEIISAHRGHLQLTVAGGAGAGSLETWKAGDAGRFPGFQVPTSPGVRRGTGCRTSCAPALREPATPGEARRLRPGVRRWDANPGGAAPPPRPAPPRHLGPLR